MKISNCTPLKPCINPIFKGYYPFTQLYKKGKLPITKGFYGGEITPQTFSIDHLIPKAKGGTNDIGNLVVANTWINNKKADKPLKDFFNPEAFEEYCRFMASIKAKNFNGAYYIERITQTVRRLMG